MPTILLPPASSPFPVEFEIPEVVLPYFQMYYQAHKKSGESPNQFAYRFFAFYVGKWVVKKGKEILEDSFNAVLVEHQDEQQSLRDEERILLSDFNIPEGADEL